MENVIYVVALLSFSLIRTQTSESGHHFTIPYSGNAQMIYMGANKNSVRSSSVKTVLVQNANITRCKMIQRPWYHFC